MIDTGLYSNLQTGIKPTVEPITVGQLMQTRGQVADLALRQAQMQQYQAEAARQQAVADQAQRDQSDQNYVQNAAKDPAVAKALGSGDFSSLQGKVQPKTLDTLQTNNLNQRKSAATLDSDTLGLNQKHHEEIEKALTPLWEAANSDDPAEQQFAIQSIPQTLDSLAAAGHLKQGSLGPITSKEDLHRALVTNGFYAGVNSAAMADKEKAQKLSGDVANEAKAKAEAAKAEAEAANAVSQNPGMIADSATRVAVDAATRANPALLTPEQTATDTRAKADLAERTKADQQRAQSENAKVYLERSKDAREQKIYDQTYGAGADQALVGVEPKLRSAATSQAQKLATEFVGANAAAQNLQNVIDSARSGNKAAFSNLPLVGVETLNALNGIKRINKAEIEQYQGAGSLLDRIQGKIGGLASGETIPKDVLDDIDALHKTLSESSAKSYNDKLDALNQNYHANFKPVQSKNTSSGSGYKEGDRVKLKNGSSVIIKKINSDGTFGY